MAQALGELERKLGELERELAAVGTGRLVDEAAEPADPVTAQRESSAYLSFAYERSPSETQPVTSPPQSEAPRTDSSAPPMHSPVPPPPRPMTAAGPPPVGLTPNSRSAAHAEQPSPAPAGASAQAGASVGAQELLRFRERLEQSTAELTREYDRLLGRISFAPAMATSTSQPVQTISFARGAPSLDIVDVQGLTEAAARAFEDDPAGSTAYGTAVGYLKLRAWIADKHQVEPENVLVTNGSLQADAFLFDQLLGPGDEVVVERPTYDRTLLSLRKRGTLVHAIELEHDGIDTGALARLLEGRPGVRPKLAHVIPNFQNPAGYTLSAAKRRALLGLAAEHGFVVFEDDPYVELRFTGEPLATMVSMDPERVVYASSFSKTVCPGTRVGYLVGPKELIAGVAERATNTYISPSMVSQAIVYEFCISGAIERSIATVKQALARRAQTLAEALRRELPEAEFVEPEGGYFMWVTLPQGCDVSALHAAAADRGVAFVKGSDFVLEGGTNTLRLAYSGVTPEQIEQGVERLAAAYRSLG
jgi:2-aminoadipate transaminase